MTGVLISNSTPDQILKIEALHRALEKLALTISVCYCGHKLQKTDKVRNEIGGQNAIPGVSFSVEGMIHCSKYIHEFSWNSFIFT